MRFKQVHEAYSTLGNPELRAAYNQQPRSTGNPGGPNGATSSTAREKSGQAQNGPMNTDKVWSDPSRMQEQFEQFLAIAPKAREAQTVAKPIPTKEWICPPCLTDISEFEKVSRWPVMDRAGSGGGYGSETRKVGNDDRG